MEERATQQPNLAADRTSSSAGKGAQSAGTAALPPAAQVAAQAAVAALSAQHADQAERHLRDALRMAPAHPGLQRLLGVAIGMQGRHAEAIAILRNAAEAAPDDPSVCLSLGNAFNASGDRGAAIATFRRGLELAPDAAPIAFNLGKTLIDDARNDEALPLLREVVRLTPDNLRARFMYADVLRVTGELGLAETEYRSVLAGHPHSGEAWLGLTGLKNLRFDGDDVERMRGAVADSTLDQDDRISIRFALARALEDVGELADSFAMLGAANALVRHWYPWNATHFSQRVDEFIAAFPTTARAAPDDLGREVIFIVSMPRSGSTLVEQILASHTNVCGAGELTDLPAVVHEESSRRGEPFPQWANKASAADWERLGRNYLERTARWRKSHARSTDKLPDNWRFVGAIAAMLPGARIVCVRRDPLETCLSCYRQMFSRGGQAFSYDIDDLAAYWRAFDRAQRHWEPSYCERYRSQSYEQLVADTEHEVRALLAFCGLDYEPACLRFHETRRSVRTASASQVREPVRGDTARAAAYGELLDPLRRALADSA